MSTSWAIALILPPQSDLTPATVEAVGDQSQRPREITVVGSLAQLSRALTNTRDSGEGWVWLLDAGVIPEPRALQEMLDVAALGSPTPALLASGLLTPGGDPDPSARAVAEVHDGERVLAALRLGTVPLRVARRGSLLVRGDAAAQLDPHEVLERDLVWSARLLGRELGVLVPASVAVRQAAVSAQPVGLGTALRVLRALPPRERAWFATHFAEEAMARPGSWRLRVRRGRRG